MLREFKLIIKVDLNFKFYLNWSSILKTGTFFHKSVKKLWFKPWKGYFNSLASENDIKYCFRLILGRNPNKEEWPGHSSFAGSELEQVVRGYLNSLEFKSRELLNYDQKIINYKTKFGFDIYLNLQDSLIGQPISQGVIYEENVTHFFTIKLTENMTF